MAVKTFDIRQFDKDTGNIYESISVIAKRARQISAKLKEELTQKLSEFATPETAISNTAEDVMVDNREQTEISKRYEKMPKPSETAAEEFLQGKIYWRNPHKEKGGN